MATASKTRGNRSVAETEIVETVDHVTHAELLSLRNGMRWRRRRKVAAIVARSEGPRDLTLVQEGLTPSGIVETCAGCDRTVDPLYHVCPRGTPTKVLSVYRTELQYLSVWSRGMRHALIEQILARELHRFDVPISL